MKENSEEILSRANMLLQEVRNTPTKPRGSGEVESPARFAGANARRAEASGEKNEQRGPHFLTKINEAKNNGWAQSFKILIAKNNYVMPLAVVGILIAILGYAMLNFAMPNNLTSTDNAVKTGSSAPSELNLINSSDINLAVTQTFTETAASGEGVTHLARRALGSYLNASGYTLNAEQKIYAEDYLKDITGSYGLNVGQEVNFSVEDIELAYTAALGLADWQIENLTQYTLTVSNL